MSRINNDFKFGINLLCIISIAAWIGVGINSMPDFFHREDFNYKMVEYYKDLSQCDKEDVHCEILKKHIRQMNAPLDSLEQFVVELINNREVTDQTISALIPEVLQPNNGLMDYDFNYLQCNFDFDVTTSEDGVIRTYVWGDGTYEDIGYNYKFLVGTNSLVSNINFNYLFNDGEITDDIFQSFEIHDMDLNNKRCYLIQTYHKNPSEFERYVTASLFSINEGGLIVKENLFNTPNGITSHISLQYHMDGEDGDSGWIFDYHDYYQTLYVPIANVGEARYISDEYELYKWDGKYFTFAGVDKHWRRK